MKKTAVITGASGGIGGAAAIQLAKEGYSLALLDTFQRKTPKSQTRAWMHNKCDAFLFALWG
ncbi:MAG: SDR family NAD(P)-dependent oxidoreductase [Clostridium sp.]